MAFRLNISHWVQMGIAAIVAAGIISVYPVIEREMNRNKPIDEWFNIRQLEVAPITPLGSFPVVVFDRTVGQEFVADWSMEIQSVEGDEFKMFCRASGIKKYEVNEVLNNQGELISWFTENFPKCEHIRIHWVVTALSLNGKWTVVIPIMIMNWRKFQMCLKL